MNRIVVLTSFVLVMGLLMVGCDQSQNSIQGPSKDESTRNRLQGFNSILTDANSCFSGCIWLDANCNGVREVGETGLASIKILIQKSDGFWTFVYTNSTGCFYAGGLIPGTTVVMVDVTTLPPGLAPTFDIDGLNTLNYATITLIVNECYPSRVDFGYGNCPPPPPPPGGNEGCTPGYWKQSQHFDSWPAAYTPNMQFNVVFDNAFPGKTLLQVLQQGGGGLNALGRHTVAALLNSASSGVNYGMTSNQVITMFNNVYPGNDYEMLKNVFAGLNERNCPLN